MASINTVSVSSRFQYSRTLIRSTGVSNDNSVSETAVKSEILQFRLEVLTGTTTSAGDQNALYHFQQLSDEDKSSLVYDGNPVSELTAEEAAELVSEDGYFGVSKTSGRIADFVLSGAGNDLEMLKAGREGILQGFAEAEKAWGGELPDISYETLAKSLEAIDERIRELGGSVVDLNA